MEAFFLVLGVLLISMSMIILIAIIDMAIVNQSKVRRIPLIISLLLCIGGVLFGLALSMHGVYNV